MCFCLFYLSNCSWVNFFLIWTRLHECQQVKKRLHWKFKDRLSFILIVLGFSFGYQEKGKIILSKIPFLFLFYFALIKICIVFFKSYLLLLSHHFLFFRWPNFSFWYSLCSCSSVQFCFCSSQFCWIIYNSFLTFWSLFIFHKILSHFLFFSLSMKLFCFTDRLIFVLNQFWLDIRGLIIRVFFIFQY